MNFLPNALDQFTTYTYNIALYQLHPNDISDYESAIQSGNRVRLVADNSVGTRYNITRVEQMHTIGHGESRAGFGNRFSLNIAEPNGTTLLKKVRENAISLGVPHPKDIKYLLVISFTGRDELNNAKRFPRKFYYPISVTNFNFQINDGGTQYSIEGVENNTQAYSYLENVLKNQITFEANTMGEFVNLLNQRIKESEELNLQYNSNAVYSDEYVIEFGEEIQDWVQWKFQQTEESLSVSGQSRVGTGANGKMHFSITNGSNITDIVGLALQCTDEYKKIVLHNGGYAREGGAHEASTTDLSNFKTFYKVITKLEYTHYDVLRGEYAKKLTYRIIPHIVADEIIDSTEYIKSINDKSIQTRRVRELYNQNLLRKRYDYLYTGNNTEIMNLDLKFNYAYFAVSVIGQGRFGDQNVVSATAGQNTATPLEKLQQNKIQLQDIQQVAQKAISALQAKKASVASIYQDSILRQTIQDDEDEISSLQDKQQQLIAEQETLVNDVQGELQSTDTDIDMRMQFAGDNIDDADVYGPENDLLGGALNFAAVKTNLENRADMVTIEMQIKGDPYWLGYPNSFFKGNDSILEVADYEKGGQFFFLKVNLGNEENAHGRREPNTEYQITALYRVINVITNYENGMFTQYLKAVRDLATNLSSVADVIEQKEDTLSNGQLQGQLANDDPASLQPDGDDN